MFIQDFFSFYCIIIVHTKHDPINKLGWNQMKKHQFFTHHRAKKCDSIYMCLLLCTMHTQEKCGNYGLGYHMELE